MHAIYMSFTSLPCNERLWRAGRAAAAAAVLIALAAPAGALNILLVNDDGLSANIQAQYSALVAAGHDVLVSVPCQNQSGKGASIELLTPLIPLTKACRNGAADVGAPGAGAIAGKPNHFYVNGTPLMATAYGLDILAPQRWGKAPDLVLSGPNEGQNTGPLLNSSGTVSNAQYAAAAGVSAIAVSADTDTTDNSALAAEIAPLAVKLIGELRAKSAGAALLPAGIVLNVNYPKVGLGKAEHLKWSFAQVGTFSPLSFKFVADLSQDPTARSRGLESSPVPGLTLRSNAGPPAASQHDDEAVVVATGKIAVSALQVGFAAGPAAQGHLRRELRHFLR
jgi:5'-nucleotidase